MKALALLAGVILAWPGMAFVISFIAGDEIRKSRLFAGLAISVVALGLLAYGMDKSGRIIGSGGSYISSGFCGSGATAYEC